MAEYKETNQHRSGHLLKGDLGHRRQQQVLAEAALEAHLAQVRQQALAVVLDLEHSQLQQQLPVKK